MIVFQIAIFEDHFNLLAGLMRGFDHGADITADIVPVPAQDLADVDHHVQLLASIGEGAASLRHFDGGGVPTVREADGGAGFHRTAC